MNELDCLRQAAIEHDRAYWNGREASKQQLIANRKLARAMRNMGMQHMHFRDLTIRASRQDDSSPHLDSVTVAETLKEEAND